MTKREAEAYICDDCGALVTVDDAEGSGPLYECGDCGTRFNRDGSANDNHQCPDCNKFASKVADYCCPECLDGKLSPLFRD